ncbi:MAG TPA: hypothetical protein DCE41_27005 [Cytophagales bacterium]|nr:hypothetical protein [Cytophagales bacterium]
MSLAQPGSEVWMLDLVDDYGKVRLENPVNISHNTGYDNQPHFLPNSDGLLYASQVDGGAIDIRRYDFATGETDNLTNSAGGKFSPTVMPDGAHFSSIHLEDDGTQLLKKFPLNGSYGPEVIIPDVVIGYHCWVNDTTLMAFVLGEPVTLQRCYTTTGTCEILDEQIGRGLKIFPLNGALTYVSKKDSIWTVNLMDPLGEEGRSIGLTMNGTEDFDWRGNGSLFKTEGNLIFRWRPGEDPTWEQIADLRDLGIDGALTRITISPDGTKVAVVAAEEN